MERVENDISPERYWNSYLYTVILSFAIRFLVGRSVLSYQGKLIHEDQIRWKVFSRDLVVGLVGLGAWPSRPQGLVKLASRAWQIWFESGLMASQVMVGRSGARFWWFGFLGLGEFVLSTTWKGLRPPMGLLVLARRPTGYIIYPPSLPQGFS